MYNWICLPSSNYEQVINYTIHNSLSFAWMIGAAKYNNLFNSISAFVKTFNGKVAIKQAKIQFVEPKNIDGFSKGTAIIKNVQNKYLLKFQNQNLVLKTRGQNGKVIGITPQIISVVQQGTGIPITTQLLRYGLIESVLIIPPPKKMGQETALRSVRPQGFGIQWIYSNYNIKASNYLSVWDLK